MALATMGLLTACIDKNYDLSDIDTTSELKVNDLVLPLNLDPITLDDIIEIKEGDKLKEVTVNGKTFYAVQEEGSFESDPINIPGFTAEAPTLTPTKLNFALPETASKPLANESGAIVLPITEPVHQDIEFSATGIDASLLTLTEIFTDEMVISMDFTAKEDVKNMGAIEVKDFIATLPKGMTVKEIIPAGSSYTDGVLTVPSLKMINGKGTITVHATGLNLAANNSELDYDTHSFTLETVIDIEDARLVITPGSGTAAGAPTEVSLDIDYTISPLDVSAITGSIRYALEGDALSISPINLDDLPDFISGDDTDLVLNNPQIYISVNNPVADDKLQYRTGLELTAIRDDAENRTFTLDKGYFTVGWDKGVTGPYDFCLSPQATPDTPEGYSDPLWEAFTGLSDVVSGNGLPKSIDIRLVDPQVYEQPVTHFALDQELQPLTGKWEFLAPLALKKGSGSKIVYTSTEDGWNDDTVDAITISSLTVNLKVTNNTPLEATLSGYPIDVEGKQIQGVTIEGGVVPGNAKEQPVTIHVTGVVKHLDGITFTATITPADDTPIAPSQNIVLTEIRAKVSGNITKEL